MSPLLQKTNADSIAESFANLSTKQHSFASQIPRLEAGVTMDVKDVVHELANDVVGANEVFHSPFGAKVTTFADYFTGGKALQSIEDHIQQNVLPALGDIHNFSSPTDLQSASYVQDARRAIAAATNAFVDGSGAVDQLILTSPGSTATIKRLIEALGLQTSASDLCVAADTRPVVFVGPFEQPADVLSWQKSFAEVISIPESDTGHVDMTALERCLKHYGNRPLRVGVFSAASTLTGLLTNVDAVTALLHRYGALSLWNYSSAAPHIDMDLNPAANGSVCLAKDAVFFSGHKFVGGRAAPGVLIVKKSLLENAAIFSPSQAGSNQLSDDALKYEDDDHVDAIGSIRLGLAVRLKQSVGSETIATLERRHVDRIRESLASSPNIMLLGHDDLSNHRLPIFSFLVRCGDRFLHYNFVCALLSDLFGVQVCVGSQGPQGARLLGLSTNDRLLLDEAVEAHNEVLRPGFLHLSLPYFVGKAEVDYILDAIHFVAMDGWKFLPQFSFDRISGEWRRRGRASGLRPENLSKLARRERQPKLQLNESQLGAHRADSMKLARSLARHCEVESVEDFCSVTLDVSLECLRWFVYPVEAVAMMRVQAVPELTEEITGPFQPEQYVEGTVGERWTIKVTPSRVPVATRRSRAKARLHRLVKFMARISRKRRADK
jgi:selenocysteine lyase/cysteine desulfurase